MRVSPLFQLRQLERPAASFPPSFPSFPQGVARAARAPWRRVSFQTPPLPPDTAASPPFPTFFHAELGHGHAENRHGGCSAAKTRAHGFGSPPRSAPHGDQTTSPPLLSSPPPPTRACVHACMRPRTGRGTRARFARAAAGSRPGPPTHGPFPSSPRPWPGDGPAAHRPPTPAPRGAG